MKEKKNATGDFVSTGETKTQKNVKKAKKKDKKPGFFKRMASKIKDVFSELKKVSWPTFGKVVKQTGIVLFVFKSIVISLFAFCTSQSNLVSIALCSHFSTFRT